MKRLRVPPLGEKVVRFSVEFCHWVKLEMFFFLLFVSQGSIYYTGNFRITQNFYHDCIMYIMFCVIELLRFLNGLLGNLCCSSMLLVCITALKIASFSTSQRLCMRIEVVR